MKLSIPMLICCFTKEVVMIGGLFIGSAYATIEGIPIWACMFIMGWAIEETTIEVGIPRVTVSVTLQECLHRTYLVLLSVATFCHKKLKLVKIHFK